MGLGNSSPLKAAEGPRAIRPMPEFAVEDALQQCVVPWDRKPIAQLLKGLARARVFNVLEAHGPRVPLVPCDQRRHCFVGRPLIEDRFGVVEGPTQHSKRKVGGASQLAAASMGEPRSQRGRRLAHAMHELKVGAEIGDQGLDLAQLRIVSLEDDEWADRAHPAAQRLGIRRVHGLEEEPAGKPPLRTNAQRTLGQQTLGEGRAVEAEPLVVAFAHVVEVVDQPDAATDVDDLLGRGGVEDDRVVMHEGSHEFDRADPPEAVPEGVKSAQIDSRKHEHVGVRIEQALGRVLGQVAHSRTASGSEYDGLHWASPRVWRNSARSCARGVASRSGCHMIPRTGRPGQSQASAQPSVERASTRSGGRTAAT